jgi:3-phenylpropionate/cinnamic acid dioxygenase small subunit
MSPDREAISDLLIRYATGIDRRDWALFRTCWTDDAEADYGALGHYHGADSLTEVMRASHDAMGPTYHRITNVVIDVAPDGQAATARSYVHAVLMLRPDDQENWIDALGHYEDELAHVGQEWRIRRRVSHIARMMTGGEVSAARTGAASRTGGASRPAEVG